MKIRRELLINLLTNMIEDVEREGDMDDEFDDDPELATQYDSPEAEEEAKKFLPMLREMLDHVTNGGDVEVEG